MSKVALTVREAAEGLGLHPETVRRLIRRGDLVGIKVGRGSTSHYRIAEEEVTRFLTEGPAPLKGAK